MLTFLGESTVDIAHNASSEEVRRGYPDAENGAE